MALLDIQKKEGGEKAKNIAEMGHELKLEEAG